MPPSLPAVRIAERAALHRVAALLAAAEPLDTICVAVARETGACVGAQTTSVVRFDASCEPALLSSWGAQRPPVPGLHDELCSVYRAGQPSRSSAELPRSPGGGLPAEQIASWVMVPIADSGQVWGVICASSPSAEPFPIDAEARMTGFADLLAVAVAHDRGRTDLSRLAEQQAVLRRLAVLVALGASRDDVLNTIAVEAYGLFDVEFTALLRYGHAGAAFIVARHHAPPSLGMGERAPDVPDGLVRQVFRSGRPARVEAYADLTGPGLARMHGLGITAGAAAPILVEGSLWGVITAMQRSGTVPAGLEHRLADFAEVAATAVSAAQANEDLHALADEQAALRRVAELVARGAALDEVFTAVAAETSKLLGNLAAVLLKYNPDDWATNVAAHNSPAPLGLRVPSGPDTVTGQLLRTGLAVRVDNFAGTTLADIAHRLGVRAGVAVPVTIEGRIWGALTTSTPGPPLPVGTEQRLAKFADLVAAAIANAENKSQLTASRARIVATADETRRRLQRDVHDGAQQRLVHTIITLKLARDSTDHSSMASLVREALQHAERANGELRDLVHGILPVSLSSGGLAIGLESLIDDFAIPVQLQMTAGRLPLDIETTAYFFVAEALTNVAKHACATQTQVIVGVDDHHLTVEVRDNGGGGADPGRGTGLIGLSDRVEAADGTLVITSTTSGTTLRAQLPLIKNTRVGQDHHRV